MTHKYNSVKHPVWSRTLWINLLFAAAAFYPPAQKFLTSYPEAVGALVAGINWILRFTTKDKLSLKKSP